jgi:hypothetical protein
MGHLIGNLQVYLHLDVIETNYDTLIHKVAAAQVRQGSNRRAWYLFLDLLGACLFGVYWLTQPLRQDSQDQGSEGFQHSRGMRQHADSTRRQGT